LHFASCDPSVRLDTMAEELGISAEGQTPPQEVLQNRLIAMLETVYGLIQNQDDRDRVHSEVRNRHYVSPFERVDGRAIFERQKVWLAANPAGPSQKDIARAKKAVE